MTLSHALVQPPPPLVESELAHIGPGLLFAESPTAYLASLREQYGDTFFVDVFGYPLFCLFSPTGLENFYQLEEQDASFGMATYDMMGFKTPTEIFMDADIDLFYSLLTIKRLPFYIDAIHHVLELEIQRLGKNGELEVFDFIRTLEQRIGFNCWIGEEAASDDYWQDLKANFDILSQELAFVNPQQTLATIKNGKAREREALQAIRNILEQIHETRKGLSARPADTFEFLLDRFASDTDDVTLRKVTHNTINANQGFLSNLYAALAWVVIQIHQHPQLLDKLAAERRALREQYGDDYLRNSDALNAMHYMEQVLMESVRMAQRSITLRKVLQEVDISDGEQTYTLQPGVYVTTMLSVTNRQTEELARFDPDHYVKNRLRPELVDGKETVSTFGHGKHACPAQKFSHTMCKIVISRLLESFDWQKKFANAQASVSQMGGVSRSQTPCNFSYQKTTA